MAAIFSAMHIQRAADLFGMPNGKPITERILEASIQWSERIRQRVEACIPNEVAEKVVQQNAWSERLGACAARNYPMSLPSIHAAFGVFASPPRCTDFGS
jgi:hypothetical protein